MAGACKWWEISDTCGQGAVTYFRSALLGWMDCVDILRFVGAFARISGPIILCAALASCASKRDHSEVYDPLESINRSFFTFNQKLDRNAALPAATFYRSAVPNGLRTGIHNFLNNINLPITFANDLLQFEFERAGHAAARFGLNTTLGILGVMDVATERGFARHTEDFGQTMAVYGMPGGPYMVLPLLGSSQPRDFAGRYVDHYFNAFGYLAWDGKVYYSLLQSGLSLVDARSRNIDTLRAIERQSVDLYATMRSLHYQNRANQIRNGRIDPADLPDFD